LIGIYYVHESHVVLDFNFLPAGAGDFFFTTVSRTTLGPTQSPIQWVPGALSLGVKRPGREADYSPPSIVKIKDAWSYTSTPPILLHGMVFSYVEGQLYLYLTVTYVVETKREERCLPLFICSSAQQEEG
jgi:hypothetical protein